MKSFLLIIISLFFINISTSFSQGFYMNLDGGYGLPVASQNMHTFYSNSVNFNIIDHNNTIKSVLKGSYGKGINFGGSFGYMFNKNLGVDLGISYLMGSAYKVADSTYINNTTLISKINGNMFRLIPSLKFSTGNGAIRPYAKVGIAIGLLGKVNFVETINDGYWDAGEITKKLSGGISIGFASATGINFHLRKLISIFAELNIIVQSYAPLKGEVTKVTFNGVDELSSWKTNQKQSVFIDSYNNDNSNPSVPSKLLKAWYPFSSAGLNIGIQFNFGKGKEAKEETGK